MSFDGLRVLALESRRACGDRDSDPPCRVAILSLRPPCGKCRWSRMPRPCRSRSACFQDQFDMMILLTGVGTRLLNQVIETRWPPGAFAEALRRITVVARGPKPMAVMREWGVPVAVAGAGAEYLARDPGGDRRPAGEARSGAGIRPPQPGTDRRTAGRGAEVTSVPVYQWDLPDDLGPLREAVGGWRPGRSTCCC